jgi:5-methylcytosine-specific restriction endonuclease McrA
MSDKTCTRCKVVKTTSDFNRSSVTRDGLHAWCRSCVSAHGREKRQRVRKAVYMKMYNAQYNTEHADIKYNASSRSRCEQYQVKYVEDVDRRVVWDRDEGYCRHCKMFVPFEDFEVDHIIPMSKGGDHSYSNVQTLCTPCNRSKADKILAE